MQEALVLEEETLAEGGVAEGGVAEGGLVDVVGEGVGEGVGVAGVVGEDSYCDEEGGEEAAAAAAEEEAEEGEEEEEKEAAAAEEEEEEERGEESRREETFEKFVTECEMMSSFFKPKTSVLESLLSDSDQFSGVCVGGEGWEGEGI